MRYFYITLTVLGVLLLIALLTVLFIYLRIRFAEKKVKRLCYEEKCCTLNKALSPFGFCYEDRDDSICSGMYPWQRETGYCRAYDEAAPSMNMVIDCEPIYFNYQNRRYLIEIWKGQYGCTTGAEIGIYVNDKQESNRPAQDLFYKCVSDEERLPMHFILYKNGKKILERNDLHWWLTGFRVGMYSEKRELGMEVGICFPNMAMRAAFCEGLMRAGYRAEDIRLEMCWVYFWFDRPHSRQPSRYSERRLKRIMRKNCRNCKRYCKATRRFCTTLDRISFIGYCFPLLYCLIVRIGVKCRKRKRRRNLYVWDRL